MQSTFCKKPEFKPEVMEHVTEKKAVNLIRRAVKQRLGCNEVFIEYTDETKSTIAARYFITGEFGYKVS